MSYYLSLGFQFLFPFKGEAAGPDVFVFNQKVCIIFFCSYKKNILLFFSSSYRSYNWLLYLQFGYKQLINSISDREGIQRLVLLVRNKDQFPFLQLLLFSSSRGRANRASRAGGITSYFTSRWRYSRRRRGRRRRGGREEGRRKGESRRRKALPQLFYVGFWGYFFTESLYFFYQSFQDIFLLFFFPFYKGISSYQNTSCIVFQLFNLLFFTSFFQPFIGLGQVF